MHVKPDVYRLCMSHLLPPQVTAWSEMIIPTLTVSVAQECRGSLPGLFWLGVSHEVAVRCWMQLHLSEGWAVAGEPTLQEALLHDSSCWCAVEGNSQFPSCGPLCKAA